MQLQLYTMEFSIHPKIPADYGPKADSSETIIKWNEDNQSVSKYLTSYHVLVPLFVFFVSLLGISYFLFASSQAYHDKVEKLIYAQTAEGWELKTYMCIIMVISTFISLYVLGMDFAALCFRHLRIKDAFKAWFNDSYPLQHLYHNISSGLLALDALMSLLLSGTLILMFSYNCCPPCCGIKGKKAGKTEGERAGETEGERAGIETEGERAGETEGERAAETEGERAGETEGERAVETERERTGETEGERAGETEGETAGETEGETAGETEGEIAGGGRSWE